MSPDSATESPSLVVLDRDGVINRDSPDFIRSVADWVPLPGSLEAIAALCRAGRTVVVATNQSGIARGLLGLDDLEAIHRRMAEAAEAAGGRIDSVFFCPHGPDDGCDCRKPAAGLFRRIRDHYGVPMNGVPAVGDSARDVHAARAAGARPILVMTGNGRQALEELGHREVEVYADLAQAVTAILEGDR